MRLAQHLTHKQFPKSLLGEYMQGLTATVGPQFDPEAQALFAAMAVQPTNAHKVEINRLIVTLKAEGLWSELTYFTAAAHTQQASVLDWKTPSRAHTLTSVAYSPFRGMRATAVSGNVSVDSWGFDNTANWLPDNCMGYIFVTEAENPFNGATRQAESSTDSNTFSLRYRSGSHVAHVQNQVASAFGSADPGVGSCAAVRTPGVHRRFLNGAFFDNAPGAYYASTNGVLLWAGGRGLSSNATVGTLALGRALNGVQIKALDDAVRTYITYLFSN